MEIDSARNHYVKQIERNDLSAFVKEHKVAEIVIASQNRGYHHCFVPAIIASVRVR
jgi:hypothetical protein